MTGAATNPFTQLVQPMRLRLPKTASVSVVVDGKRIDDLRQIDEGDRQAYAKKVLSAKAAARYQAARKDPEKMAKRQAWQEANRDKVIAYKKQWDTQHMPQVRKAKADHTRRKYWADPELARQRAREYYARNRERILERAAAKSAAIRAAKASS